MVMSPLTPTRSALPERTPSSASPKAVTTSPPAPATGVFGSPQPAWATSCFCRASSPTAMSASTPTTSPWPAGCRRKSRSQHKSTANADPNIPVIEATFSRAGDSRSFWTEYISSDDTEISMTWYDFIDPFVIRVEAGTRPAGPHGLYSCFIPAKGARLAVNGQQASGEPQSIERGGHPSTTAALALSESLGAPH